MEELMAWIARLALVLFILFLVWVVAMMRINSKAGFPGWLAIIPIVNMFILAQIAGKSGWWGLLWFGLFVLCYEISNPVIQTATGIGALVLWVIITHGIAKNFGKGGGFTVGLLLLPGIFHCILGFGSAQYLGPNGQQQEIQPEEV